LDRILVLLHELPPLVVFGKQPSTHGISSGGDASYPLYRFLRLLPHQSPLLFGGTAGALPDGLEGVFRFLRDSDIKQEYTGLLLTH